MFQELEVSYHYETTKEENIVKEFYIPVLSKTKFFKRTIGYFSTESLVLASKGIIELIENDGKYQLIASIRLSKEDIKEIKDNPDLKCLIIERVLANSLEYRNNEFENYRLNALSTLLANNQLEIKVAVPRDLSFKGIMYEQMGISEDSNGELITFTCQINEKKGEYFSNFEAIDVFCSWNYPDQKRVESKVQSFNKLWNGQNDYYEIINLPEAIINYLLSFKGKMKKYIDPEVVIVENIHSKIDTYPKMPTEVKIRDYQKEAIINWFRNNCQGLLEMATGTGKTITALCATTKLYEVIKRLGIIIVCPYTHLVDQWVKEIKLFNMSPIVAYQSRSLWEDSLYSEVSSFKSRIINHFCLITTVTTFTSKPMQDILKKLNSDVLFIADEAHHLGAKKNSECLISSFPYRLALSATPNRWHDEEGTDELIEYFGNSIVFEFGLDKAIGEFLTEYYYYPHLVYLDDDEYEYYLEITKKIAKMYFQKDKNKENDPLQFLLIERSRILSRARNKLIVLRDLMRNQTESKFNIVYCGDSDVDGEKQIDSVVKLLGNDLNMKVHTFTSREDKEQRRVLLKRFENGDLQALVAIKCLDEGVDVPATQTAYILSSSTNPREFIQRRGRVLRKHNNKKYSNIHDFIVVPRKLDDIDSVEPSVFNIERNMIKRELTRFIEFADMAINGPIAHEQLNQLKKAYHLLDI